MVLILCFVFVFLTTTTATPEVRIYHILGHCIRTPEGRGMVRWEAWQMRMMILLVEEIKEGGSQTPEATY